MINNYTKLSTSNDTWLKNGKGVARGIPPGARTKASNTWLVSMMMLFLLLVGDVALAQVSYTQAFTSNAGSWTGNFSQFTGTTACGGSGGAMRRNLYGSAPTGELISPNLGTSNGTTLQTITYAYKAANWSANTVGTNPWGSFDVQYGSSATGPWTTIATVSQETQNGSCISKSHTFTPPAGNLFIRFSATRTAGDYYLNFDEVNISFVPTTPPSCATALVPAAGATNVARNVKLSWAASAGASSYDVYYSTTSPAVFKGNVATNSYTVPVFLLANTTYYYKVIAKNVNGDAIGCTEQSFTTGTILNYCLPITSYGCGDGDVIARVTLNTLDNNSGTGCPSDPVPGNQGIGQNGPGYSDYRNLSVYPTLTTTLQAGSTYGCTVYAGQYSEGYAAWIDYNDDGVFDNATERIGFSSGQVTGSGVAGVLGSSATFPIVLACNPPLGQHTLRVRAMFSTNGSAVTPCTDNSYGEIEDYLVTISAADPCPTPNTLAASSITNTSASLSWVLGCAETNWEIAVQNASILTPPASGNAVNTTTYSASGLTPATNYVFYVRAACTPGSLYSSWAGPFAFTTLPNAPGCGTNVSPANGATNLSLDSGFVTVSWTAPAVTATEGAAASYDVYGGTTSGALTLFGNVTGTSADITGLGFNTTYFWRIVPRNAGGAAVGPCAEWSFTTAGIPANDICSGAVSLDALTSPITGSTTGLTDNFFPPCHSEFTTHSAPDSFYSITVLNGYTLTINQPTNSYDSVHTVFYGSCASQTAINCVDDPDDTAVTWTNNTGSTQTVYWVQDGYGSASGTFSLAWTLTPPPVVVTSFAPAFVCGQAGGATVTITGSNFVNVTSVKFYGIEATSFNVVNETTITAVVPAGNVTGPVSVTSTPSSNGMGTSTALFEARPFPTNYPTVSNPIGVHFICGTETISLENPGALGVWNSTNPSVATVSAGTVTGVNEGTTNITYTVTDNGCSSQADYAVTVSNPIINVTNPINVNAITGTPASFTTSASGTIVSYQWQVYINGDGPFALSNGAIYSGVNTPTLSIPVTTEDMNNNEYFCLITGVSPCANVETGAAILKVGNTGIITNPSSVNLCNGGQAQFTVVPTGTVESYVWYEDNGFGFGDPIVDGGDFSGATTATLTVSNVTTTNRNGFSYYVVVNGPANSPESGVASINVSVPASISGSPSNQTVCYTGGSTSFTVAANNALGYQWQYSSVGGANDSNWTTITGAAGPVGITYAGFNTATLGVTVTNAVSPAVNYFYRAIALSGVPCPNAKSEQAQLIINNPIVAIATPNGTVSCGGAAVTLTASGADGFVWSTGATTASISVSPASQTTYTVTGTTAGCSKQATVIVTVGGAVLASASSNDSTVCVGGNVQLQASASSTFVPGNVGSYIFTPSSSPYVELTGATSVVINSGAGSSGDDAYTSLLNIGFPFYLGSNSFTQFSISSNGAIRLGALFTSTTAYSALSASDSNIIAFNARDLNNSGAEYSYVTVGTAPNRILKIQAKNFYRYNTSTHLGNAQVWLYEGSNRVEIRYGNYATNWTSAGAQVGLRGASTASTDVRSVSSTTWAAITAASASNSSTATITQGTTNQVVSGTLFTFAPGNTPTYTYTWTASNANGTLTGANTANATANPNAPSTTYTVVVTSNTGCTDTKSVTVTVDSGVSNFVAPTAQTICAGQTATLTASATGPGLQYSWYKVGNPTSVGSGATLSFANATVAQSGNYYVVVTPACGAAVSSINNPVALTINPLPTATISGTTAVCTNGTAPTVTFTGSNGTAPYTFTYTINGGADLTIVSNASGVATLVAPIASSGTFVYALKSVQGQFCSQPITGQSATITVNEAPTPVVISGTNVICANSNPTLLSASGGSSIQAYCTPFSVSNTGSTGDYLNNFSFANLTNNNNGDAATDYTYYNGLTANVVANGTTAYPISLQAGGTSSLYTQQFRVWIDFNQNGTFEASESVFSTTTATFAPSSATGTVVIPTTALNGITRMRVASKYSSVVADTESCSIPSYGEFEDYNVSITGGVNPAPLVVWTSANGGLFTDANGNTPYNGTTPRSTIYARPTASGNISATVTAVNGCSNSGSFAITVNPVPTASISGTVAVCHNDATPSVTFTGANAIAPYTFTYSLTNVVTNVTTIHTLTTTSGNSATVIAPTDVVGVFVYDLLSVQDSSSTACAQAQSGSATVTVNPLPSATIAGSTQVCRNDAAPLVTFTGSNGTAPYTFTYKVNGGTNQTVVSSGNTATIAQPTGTPGTFVYTLVGVKDSSSATCSNAQSGTVTIVVHPTPTVVAVPNQLYYSGFATAAIPLTGTPSGVTFNISGGAASGLADVNGVTAIPSFIPTTTPSTVTITPVANGCVGVPVTYQIAFNPVVVNITSNACGSINHGLNNTIQCSQVSVPGYTTTGYMFEVTNTATGEVAVVFSSQHHFKLTDSNNYAYGTTFTIRVAAVLNGQVQGYFGSTCSLTTASVATSRVVTAQCGSTLVFINSTINANSVSSTNLYRFRVALASAPTVTYLVERSVPNFKLTDVVGLPLLFNTEYLVDVQIRVKLAGFEAWSQYGVRCSIFTPAAPETSLLASQCEDYAVPSSTSPISAIAFPGATAYRFRLTGYDEFGDVNYQQAVTNAGPSFTLSQFTGLTPGATYTVAVAMELFGTFTDYAKDCSIIVPLTGKQVTVEPFKATAYPNPFAANFMIDVKTTSDSVISIKVYDMVGRLVEQKTATVAQLENAPIGNNYPSGVYNVVVTQDETVQTVRVVKR